MDENLGQVKVLSWNIHGNAGTSADRTDIVTAMVREKKPDVLLLQEVQAQQILQNLPKKYKRVPEKVNTSSLVLYNSDKFVPSTKIEDETLLIDALHEVGGNNVIGILCQRERISMVRLKFKTYPKEVIFVSFHNMQRGPSKTRMVATKFCDMVEKMREITGTDIVAGADLNCYLEHPTITKYAPDTRNHDFIDHFILAPPEEDPSIDVVESEPLNRTGKNYRDEEVYICDHLPLLYDSDIR